MVPKPLTEDICGCRETGLFCYMEMTPKAEIISTRYTKAIVKSCAALSYVEAQARMDDRWWLQTLGDRALLILHQNAGVFGVKNAAFFIPRVRWRTRWRKCGGFRVKEQNSLGGISSKQVK